jgi:hypothetical protein
LMKRASVVVVFLLWAVLGTPPTAFASGSYGAVVEKGVRGCATDDLTGIVICFEAPSVNPESRGVFLQVWRAASPYLGWGHTLPATMRVRSVFVTAGASQAGRPVVTYVARTDLVSPHLECRDDFRFHASNGSTWPERIVSDCKPL